MTTPSQNAPSSETPPPDDEPSRSHHNTLDTRLLEMLVCPLTRKPLEYNHETQELISKAAGLAYPIVDGIPIMLVEKARNL
jgi:hypothetical protein